MSVLDRVRVRGAHRRKTPAQLARELDAAKCTIIRLATDIVELTAERNQLEAAVDDAAIELSGAIYDADEQAGINEQLTSELHVLRAKVATDDAIDVPPMIRDTDNPADQATHPDGLDVQQLRDDMADSKPAPPVEVRVGGPNGLPFTVAANPTRIDWGTPQPVTPAWAVTDDVDTQQLRSVEAEPA